MTSAAPIATRHGTFVAQFNDIGLCRLDFPGKARAPKPAPKPTGLAKRTAARAVGSACGANPIPIIVPCHRVLAAHRRIGGFSGGPGWKQRLLRIEQAEFVG